jgi:hypothetical protein
LGLEKPNFTFIGCGVEYDGGEEKLNLNFIV